MKIVVLHWHGICPHCGKPSCIYVNFVRQECGCKLPHGFECGSCNSFITDDEFDAMQKIECPCPKEVVREVKGA